MKMQVRSEDTTIFYPLATWSWEAKNKVLIQRIPRITEVQFHIPGSTKTPPLEITEHLLRPSLQIGQELRLSDVVYYVANIEPLPVGKDFDGTTYVYYLTECPPVVPAFWTVEVTEEIKQ